MNNFKSKEFFYSVMEQNSSFYSRKYPLENEEFIKKASLKKTLEMIPLKLLDTPNYLVKAHVPIESFMGDFFNSTYSKMIKELMESSENAIKSVDAYKILKSSFPEILKFYFSYFVFADKSVLLTIVPDKEARKTLAFMVEYAQFATDKTLSDSSFLKGVKHIADNGANVIMASNNDFKIIMQNQLLIKDTYESEFFLLNTIHSLNKEEITQNIFDFIDNPFNSSYYLMLDIVSQLKNSPKIKI